MLDLKYVVTNTEAIKQNCRDRNVSPDVIDDIDRIVALESERRDLLQAVEEVRRRQNEVAQSTGREKDAEKRAALIEEGKRLKSAVAEEEERLRRLEAEVNQRLKRIPNLTHPDAPVGQTEDDSRELRKVGTPRDLRLQAEGPRRPGQGPRPHRFRDRRQGQRDRLLLPQERRRAARPGAPAVRGQEADRARLHADHDARPGPQSDPGGDRLHAEGRRDPGLLGRGHRPQPGRHGRDHPGRDARRRDPRRGGLAGPVRRALPLLPDRGRRRRAGPAAGSIASTSSPRSRCSPSRTPETSGPVHAEMLAIEEDLFQSLGIPYRVLDICTGDLGGPAYRKFDLEAWMPGRGEHGEYGEVTSTSDCTDYQARRLNIRYRPAGQKGTRFVHTLNGTAIALSRAIIVDPGELPASRRSHRRARGPEAVHRQGRDRGSLNARRR